MRQAIRKALNGFHSTKGLFYTNFGTLRVKIPKNVWCILPYLLFVGLLSDVMLFRLFSSYGVTLLIAQVAGLLGSIAMIGIAGRIFWPDIMSGYRITFSPLFAFGTFLLIILRSGFFILAYQSVWEGTVFPPILIAAFSSMVISLYLTTLISSRKQGAINPILQSRFILLAVILISVVLRLLFAGSFELLHQEAYYWNYAQHLASGYLDHPPMVALLIKSGSFFFGNTEFAVRIGAILCWGIASLFVFFYSRDISNRDTALQTVTLMSVLPAFFSFGLLMTPDAPLIACWAGSIFYARRAIVEMDGKSWIGVGLFLGLGLISKYTIAILGLSFLVFIISDASSRRWLLKPQPYLSAALALLIFSPVIWWNSQHEWVSFLFQTKERLVSSSEFSSHELFASIILLLSPLGFWVAMLFLLNRKYFVEKAVQSAVRQYKFALIMVAVPFTVFLIFSLTKEVKLNWTTPIWLAALPYMASTINKITNSVKSISFGRIYFPRAWTITIVTLLLAYGSALHYFSIGIPGIPYPSYGPLLWLE